MTTRSVRLRTSAERRHERRHVEEVAQALAVGFEQDRKRSEPRRHGQQVRGALALLPQRRAHARAAALAAAATGRRSRGTSRRRAPSTRAAAPPAPAPHRGPAAAASDRAAGPRPETCTTNPSSPQSVSTSTPVSSRTLAATAIAHGRVDTAAPRRQHADAPVAELVADALDDDRRGVGHGAGRGHLIAEVLHQVFGGAPVEVVVAREPLEGGGGRKAQQVAHEPPDHQPELERTAGSIALPERHLPRLAWCGRHEHAVVRDLLDPPGRGAEHEGLADCRLEHHLFVELADAGGARAGAGQEHAEEAAVGNRAGVGDRHALCALARDDGASPRGPR